MSVRLPGAVVSGLVAVYPRAVRDRYGEEIAGLLGVSRRPVRDAVDVLIQALVARTRMVAGVVGEAMRRARPRPFGGLDLPVAVLILAFVVLVAGALTGHALGSARLPGWSPPVLLAVVLGLHNVAVYVGRPPWVVAWLCGVAGVAVVARRWGPVVAARVCLVAAVVVWHVRVLPALRSDGGWLGYVRAMLLVPPAELNRGGVAVASVASAVLMVFAMALGLAYLRSARLGSRVVAA